MRKARRGVATVLAVLLTSASAAAHHPGHDLDRVMGNKERFFQSIEKPTPQFVLRDVNGKAVTLADFQGKVVVLHFIYTSCPDVCPLHAERIAAVQAMVNKSAMKNRVQFISITTDPAKDVSDVMRSYGSTHGLDQFNWRFLTTLPGQPEDMTRRLAESFGHTFTRTPDGIQAHGVVTHIIDKQGRWRANFHGLRFAPINLVLYINGLTNEAVPPRQRE